MQVPDWYVITGGPDSGKTTTVDYIAKLGYTTIPEYARTLIDREMKKGKKLEEIRKDEVKFQDRVAKGKLQLEKHVPKGKTIFLDRGIPDNIAYYHYLKSKVPEDVLKVARNRYKKVFLLDMLPYQKDYARDESKKEAKKIHNWIKKIYKELGYHVIKVPVMPIEDRVKLILKNIK